MSHDLDKNKINDKQKRRAEPIKDKLEHQGVGQDEAKKRGVEQAVAEIEGGRGGGGNAGAESKSRT